MTQDQRSPFTFLHPEGWQAPRGYRYGAISDDGAVWTVQFGGVTGMDAAQGDVIMHPGDLVAQAGSAFDSIAALMRCASQHLGVEVNANHIFHFTIYTSSMGAYRKQQRAVGEHYRRVFGKCFAPTELIGVSELYNPDALVEFVVTLKVRKP